MKASRFPHSILLCWFLCAAFWSIVSIVDRWFPASMTAASVRAVSVLSEYVNDEKGILSQTEKAALNEKLRAFDEETSSQAVVAIVAQPEDADIERFSIRAAEQARLGQSDRDNGVILFLFPNEGIARIEVGYGLEGVLPDVLAHRLLVDDLAPAWREGRRAKAIEATVDALTMRIRNEYSAREKPGRMAILFRKLDVGGARLLREAWPRLRGVDVWQRIVSSFFAGLVLFCLWDGARQAKNLVENVRVAVRASKPGAGSGKTTVSVSLDSIRDGLVLLFIGVGGIIAAAGAVVLADGGSFGGAGATLHF